MSENSPAPAPATPPPLPKPWEKLADFSDKLSPMLVKELRQGLRTHTFVILFLVLQGFLALILLTTASAGVNAGNFVSGVIFCFFSLAVLVIQPLRGMSAISSEVKGDTIDLMVLTRLSAWRITFGKWASIVSQSGLILCTIVPYLILRYFFGEMQLFSELMLLAGIFLLSMSLTALTVGISGCPLTLVRILPLLGAIFLIFPIFAISFSEFDDLLRFVTPERPKDWFLPLGFVFLCVYAGYFFLELGTSFIAPAAENRATVKRIVAAAVVLTSFLSLVFVEVEAAWVISLILLAFITLDVFTEREAFPSIVTRPFLRLGPFGAFLGRILYPGWATGLIFHTVLFAAVVGLGLAFGGPRSRDVELWEGVGILFGALQFPVVFLNIFQKRLSHRFSPYLVITAMLCALIPLFAIVSDVGSEGMIWTFCFIPHVQPWMAFEINPHPDVSLAIIWGCAAIYFAINFCYALPHLLRLRKLELEELDSGPES